MHLLIHNIAELQRQYMRLKDSKILTKQNICDLCIPFRDKYGLTDLETLRIARGEMNILEIDNLFNIEKKQLFPYETHKECECRYCPPIWDFIHCEHFGSCDGMDGSCINCFVNEPLQWNMCKDEEDVRHIMKHNNLIREDAIKRVKELKERRNK